MVAKRLLNAATLLFVSLSFAARAGVTFELHDLDPDGQGLNDPQATRAEGGNTGATLGEQRRNVLLEAARRWSEQLQSEVAIHFDASFASLPCSNSVVLGSAGATMVFRNFSGVAETNTWYPGALADSLAGADLDPGEADIIAQFNALVDTDDCLPGARFYYGLDHQPPPGTIDLLAVALHELGHGLGVASYVDETSGSFLGATPDAFSRRIFDLDAGLAWPSLDQNQRARSATNTRRVVWTGELANAAASSLETWTAALAVTPTPPGFTGVVDTASFGPSLHEREVVGTLVAAEPATACEPITPVAPGSVVLVARGDCSFVTKVSHVEDAGGAAALIHNIVAASPPGGMLGASTVSIPALRLTADDGARLRDGMATGSAVVRLFAAPQARGRGSDGRLLLHTPFPVQPGSSVSHWAPIAQLAVAPPASSELLMEPILGTGIPSLGVAVGALLDLGWAAAAPLPPSGTSAPQPGADASAPPLPQPPAASDGGLPGTIPEPPAPEPPTTTPAPSATPDAGPAPEPAPAEPQQVPEDAGAPAPPEQPAGATPGDDDEPKAKPLEPWMNDPPEPLTDDAPPQFETPDATVAGPSARLDPPLDTLDRDAGTPQYLAPEAARRQVDLPPPRAAASCSAAVGASSALGPSLLLAASLCAAGLRRRRGSWPSSPKIR